MNAIMPKGWCPSLYEPMASGDGLLVRIRPPGSMLTADAARQLCAAAGLHGNGVIELTSRAAIQVRGLAKMRLAPFAAAMVTARLAHADPNVERRRTVIVAPLAGDDVRRVAAQVEARLICEPRLAALPAKFAVAVDGDSMLPLGDLGAHIQITCGAATCSVTLMGTRNAVTVATSEVADAVVRLAQMLPDIDARRPSAPRELKAIGRLSYGDGKRGAFGVGLPFGATTAAVMASLAPLAEEYGDGTLRVTPWRAVLFPNISAVAVTQLRDACGALGLIVDPVDPRLAVIACPGQPACASATVQARADAMRLVTLGLPRTVHVSGCAKGCAHPGPARITLIGENGRYGVVRNGRPSDAPSVRDLGIDQVIAALGA
jgi:precorrin-3B synthase